MAAIDAALERHRVRRFAREDGIRAWEHWTCLSHELVLHSQDEAVKLLGKNGEIRKRIQESTPGVRIVDRGAKVLIQGDDPDAAMVGRMLAEMLVAVRNGHTPSVNDISYALTEARDNGQRGLSNVYGAAASRGLRADLPIKPRTRGQAHYLDAIRSHGVTLVIGPAGTGKTYLAMAAAVSALLTRK